MIFSGFVSNKGVLPYQNSEVPIEKRVNDLVSRMTLQEKIRQMDMYRSREFMSDSVTIDTVNAKKILSEGIGAIHDFYPETSEVSNGLQKFVISSSRLGIPALFIEEGLHGYQGLNGTDYPVPMGMGSMWDPELVYKIGHAIAEEARSVGVHMLLSPVLGLSRELRWGRVQELYGEDTYLVEKNGCSMVSGMQGNDLTASNTVVSEPKHFGIHSVPQGGLNAASVHAGVDMQFYDFDHKTYQMAIENARRNCNS